MAQTEFGKRILFIGDDKQNVDLVAKALTDEGYQVDKAYTIIEGLKMQTEKAPNILLLDSNTPGLDPVKIVSQIRQNAASYTLTVLVSDPLPSSEMARLMEGGVDDFLFKPFGRQELFTRVKSRMLWSSLHQKIESTNKKMASLSINDELTGLFNLKSFSRRLEHEVGRAKRYKKWLSVIMIDMDHFKKIAGTKGKKAADAILVQVAQVLKDWTRGVDLLARIGEDQFVAILPETPTAGAERVAGRLKDHIEAAEFKAGDVVCRATASLGVVSVNYSTQNYTIDDLLKAAHDAVEDAKKLGRNFIQKKMVS